MNNNKVILWISIPLAFLTAFASFAGIFFEPTYSSETANYAAQGLGQDIINLFLVVPALIISSIAAVRKSKKALFIWSGCLMYLAYSYAIYSFALHFNAYFLVYCMVLGLSFYGLIFYIYLARQKEIHQLITKNAPTKLIGYFLIIIALLFYTTWLADIIPPAISGQVPKSIIDNGLLSNPVHVLDIAICLPALLLVGTGLIKRKAIAYILAPTLILFCVLMSAAIGGMVLIMHMKGFEADLSLSILFGIIAITGIVLLLLLLKNQTKANAH